MSSMKLYARSITLRKDNPGKSASNVKKNTTMKDLDLKRWKNTKKKRVK